MRTIYHVFIIFMAILMSGGIFMTKAGAVSQTLTATIRFSDGGSGYSEHGHHGGGHHGGHHNRHTAQGTVHIGSVKHQSIDISIKNFKSDNGIAIKSVRCSFQGRLLGSCNQVSQFFHGNQRDITVDAALVNKSSHGKKVFARPKYDILVVYN